MLCLLIVLVGQLSCAHDVCSAEGEVSGAHGTWCCHRVLLFSVCELRVLTIQLIFSSGR